MYFNLNKSFSMPSISKEKKALEIISKTLLQMNESLAVAESVTGGLIQSRLALGKDATLYFQGGITAYNLGQKVKHLNIDPILGERSNCVSMAVAREMACNVTRLFNSSWGIAITGYAAPVPALKVNECFAFYSFAYKGQSIFEERLDTKLKSAAVVQRLFAEKVIESFANYLTSENTSSK
jgi:nicotinamide-nucleotide amidase